MYKKYFELRFIKYDFKINRKIIDKNICFDIINKNNGGCIK